MEIIKEAFTEGRETDTKWSESKAKENQLKLEVNLENSVRISKHAFKSAIRMQQIDPKTGEVLNIFPSRMKAAEHIVSKILKNPPNKSAVSVTGNMEICMRAGWKCYGYYWKLLDEAKYVDSIVAGSRSNNTKVFTLKNGLESLYPSISAAAKSLGIAEKTIRKYLQPEMGRYNNITFHEYNPTPKTKKFTTIKDAAIHAKVDPQCLTRRIKYDKPIVINNIKYILPVAHLVKNPIKYVLWNGKRTVGHYKTLTALANDAKVTRSTASKALKNNRKFGNMKQFYITKKGYGAGQ